MLQLKNIVKDYVTANSTVRALKGVSLSFRKSEFVAILGPSGCGKTTMLNIIGGLDRYTEGDLVISGRSTKDFKAYDWDAYRNSCIGFVFQSYNLIPHQSVLSNVELALTLSGKSKAERRQKAIDALERVGLKEQIHKRPNQLSGGQMQRVAIARAIVNDPEIILADEPTGALDSKNSVQIVDLLKEISKDRLIIMVTHNDDLAKEYATRTVKLLDGEIVGDSNPYQAEEEVLVKEEFVPAVMESEQEIEAKFPLENDSPEAEKKRGEAVAKYKQQREKEIKRENNKRKAAIEREKKRGLKKTSMSYFTALTLSFKNLLTKKGRTILTAVAGSIGIIGIALVLSISNGFTIYIDKMQSDTLAGLPITISMFTADMDKMMNGTGGNKNELEAFPDGDNLNVYTPSNNYYHLNMFTDEYMDYLSKMDTKLYNDISKSYSISMNVLSKKADGGYSVVDTSKNDSIVNTFTNADNKPWQELLGNREFVLSQYDVIAGSYPQTMNEAVLIVDKYNRISTQTLSLMGLSVNDASNATLSEMIGKELRVIQNDDWYRFIPSQENPGRFESLAPENYDAAYNSENSIPLKITGVLRVNEGAPLSVMSNGIGYLPSLTEFLLESGKKSVIGKMQAENNKWVYLAGMSFDDYIAQSNTSNFPVNLIPSSIRSNLLLQSVGAASMPTTIYVYPKNFDAKDGILEYLDAWNARQSTSLTHILYIDAADLVGTSISNIVDIITIALVAFAAVSLVVSSIMIGIITYVSVIERTKEIGVLRSIGARKRDVTRVFNAETILVGFVAGLIGVFIAFILTFPINVLISNLAGGMVQGNMAILDPLAALCLVVLSTVLTLIAGFIPSKMAARKDPVVALRSE